MSALLDAVDTLYAGVVSEPDAWNEQKFVDWSDGFADSTELDRVAAKYIRRVMSAGRKLQVFWSARLVDETIDWQSRVDLALGNRAWRPVLDLATHLLSTQPSHEAFARASLLFRMVNHELFLDGVSYEEWIEG